MIYSISEFAELAGVSVKTLQRWDRDGILKADRSVTNRRQYTDEHLSGICINRLGKAAQQNSTKSVHIKRRAGRPGVDLTDRYFGELHVLERAEDYVYPNGRHDVMWLCECSCGNRKSIRTNNLVSGGTISCGCMRAGRRVAAEGRTVTNRKVSDLVMQRTESMVHKYYGRWYVDSVDYDSCNDSDTKIRLNCICLCGTRRSVLRSSLLGNTSVSCGCYRRDVKRENSTAEDLSGRRFGLWKVESRGETRMYPGGGQVIMWNCVCECGTRKAVSRLALKSGESQSCGCLGEPGMRSESIVSKCLDDLGYTYVKQKKYDDLLGTKGKQLSYDFMVCLYDKYFLVECQGEQHYKPIAFFGGEDVYAVQVEHDKRKREYCKSHDLPLLEIPYTVRSYDDILEKLQSFVSTLIEHV